MFIGSQSCVPKVLMCNSVLTLLINKMCNGVLTLLINKINFIAVCLLCHAYSRGSAWGGVAMVMHGAVFGGGLAMVTHGAVFGVALSWRLSGVRRMSAKVL